MNFGPLSSTFLSRECLPSGHVPASKTLKVIPPVLNHLNIVSEEHFKFQEFYFPEMGVSRQFVNQHSIKLQDGSNQKMMSQHYGMS